MLIEARVIRSMELPLSWRHSQPAGSPPHRRTVPVPGRVSICCGWRPIITMLSLAGCFDNLTLGLVCHDGLLIAEVRSGFVASLLSTRDALGQRLR